MRPKNVTESATPPRKRPTAPACSRKAKTAQVGHQNLSKALTRARWARRINTGRIDELRAELARREAKAAELDAAVDSASAALLRVDPESFARLHDVSGGVR